MTEKIERVLVATASGHYCELSEMVDWLLFEKGISMEGLYNIVYRQFGIDQATVLATVRDLLEKTTLKREEI